MTESEALAYLKAVGKMCEDLYCKKEWSVVRSRVKLNTLELIVNHGLNKYKRRIFVKLASCGYDVEEVKQNEQDRG